MTTGGGGNSKQGNRRILKRRRSTWEDLAEGASPSRSSSKRQGPPDGQTWSFPPSQREINRRPSVSSVRATLSAVPRSKFPEIEIGPTGYRAPININDFPLPVVLPEWLTEPNICCTI